METTNVNEKRFLVSREIYLQMKQDQKVIAQSGTDARFYQHKLVERRRQYFHSKGMQVPNDCYIDSRDPKKDFSDYGERSWSYKERHKDWYEYAKQNPIEKPSSQKLDLDARALNIVYGIIRGREYSEIEPKVREGNEPSNYLIEEVCNHYGIGGMFSCNYDYRKSPVFSIEVKI